MLSESQCILPFSLGSVGAGDPGLAQGDAEFCRVWCDQPCLFSKQNTAGTPKETFRSCYENIFKFISGTSRSLWCSPFKTNQQLRVSSDLKNFLLQSLSCLYAKHTFPKLLCWRLARGLICVPYLLLHAVHNKARPIMVGQDGTCHPKTITLVVLP